MRKERLTTSHEHTRNKKNSKLSVKFTFVQYKTWREKNLCALPSQMRVQRISNIKQRECPKNLLYGKEQKSSRLLRAHYLSSIKDSVITWHVEKRADTFPVILRSMLEQGPSFYPVRLHDICTVLTLLFGGKKRWALSWTVVMWWHWCRRYSPVLVNSKSVCWVR